MKKILIQILLLASLSFSFGVQTSLAQTVCVYGSNNCSNTVTKAQYNSGQKYPEACAVLTRTLKRDDQGEDVKRLQIIMGQEGISYIGATGYYGPVTERAIKTWQIRNGIYPAGKVGPQTLAAMRRAWCGGAVVNPNPTYPIGTATNQEISFMPTGSNGNNLNLSWTSKNTVDFSRNISYCTLNNERINGGNGTRSYPVFTETTFTLNCYDNGGRTYVKTVTVKPNQNLSNLPTVSTYINPSSVLIGQTATLYWSSTNANYCTVSGVNTYNSNSATSGSVPITVTSNGQSFTVTCYGSTGASASQTVYSSTNPGVSGPSFTVSPQTTTISSGQSVNISLSGTNLSSCYLNANSNTQSTLIPLSITSATTFPATYVGNITVNPTISTTYSVTCSNSSGMSNVQNVYVNVSGTTSSSLEVTVNSDKSNYNQGESVNFNILVRNNGNSNVTYNEPICDPFYSFMINGISVFSTPQAQCLAIGFNAVTLSPGQTKSYTLNVPGGYSNITNTAGNKIVNFRFFPTSSNGTINITKDINLTVGGATSGGHTVSVNTSNVSTGNTLNFSWNYNALYSCMSLGCSQPENPNGVIFDLINANTNQVVGTIKRLPTYNMNDFSYNGNQNWTVTKSLQDIRNDAFVCTTINGENLCGNLIYSGNYKIRATFFNPANACFGFCPQVPGQKTLATVESQTFYINSTLASGTNNINLVSRVNGIVTINIPGCSAGNINWGNGVTTSYMNENTGCNFSHTYNNASIGQSYNIQNYGINGGLTGSLVVVPYPSI